MIDLGAYATHAVKHVRKFWALYALALFIVLGIATVRTIRDWRENAAIQKHETKAEQAEDNALKHEGKADAAKDQADAIEAERRELERRIDEANRQLAAQRQRLSQLRKEYDEAQSGKAVIDRSGSIADRERRIGSKLDQLYPDIAIGAGAVRN